MNYLIEEQKQLVSALVSHTKTLKKDTKDFEVGSGTEAGRGAAAPS